MPKTIRFILNDRDMQTSLPPGMVVLDFLRRDQRLTGTKEGCREGDCGACMVLLGELDGDDVRYQALNSCLLPLGDVRAKHLVSIEGLNHPGLNPIQQSIVDEGASQCGFCTPGFVVSLTGFFMDSRDMHIQEAVDEVAGNICRCTGYTSIRRAIASLIEQYAVKLKGFKDRIKSLVDLRFLPSYFLGIAPRLKHLKEMQAEAEAEEKPVLLVAGGTDLFVQKPDVILNEDIKFISSRKELSGINLSHNLCTIGCATPIEDLKNSPLLQKMFPRMSDNIGLIASAPIRRRATVGGNIVNASPIGDMIIFFLALDASLTISNGKNVRRVALKDFYKGYKDLDLHEGEILEYLSFPLPAEASLFNFEKVSRRRHLDIASVNSALYIQKQDGTIDHARLFAGGVAPVPLFLRRTSEYLSGKEITPAIIKEAVRRAGQEISPISDVRGTAAYKRLLLGQLIYAHFMTLFPGIKVEDLI